MPLHYILHYMYLLIHYYSILVTDDTSIFPLLKTTFYYISFITLFMKVNCSQKKKKKRPKQKFKFGKKELILHLYLIRFTSLSVYTAELFFPISFLFMILSLSQGYHIQIQRRLTMSFYLSYSSKSYNIVSLGSFLCLLYSMHQKIRL